MGGFEEALGNWSELNGAENRTRYGVLALAGTGLLSPGPRAEVPYRPLFCVQLTLKQQVSKLPSGAGLHQGQALAVCCSSSLTLARLMIGALSGDQRDYVLASRFGSMAALRQRGQVLPKMKMRWPGPWGKERSPPGPQNVPKSHGSCVIHAEMHLAMRR